MRKPTKDCEHARRVIENKRSYSEAELTEGCWACGTTLELDITFPPITSLDHVSMDEGLREEFAGDPVRTKKYLDSINRPRYHCPRCWAEEWEQIEQERAAGYPNSKSAEQVFAELFSDDFAEKYRELIRSIEKCGSDCPWWGRLEQLRKDYGE